MTGRGVVSLRWVGLLLLLLFPLAGRAPAGQQLNPSDPVTFFTNLASRLLKAEMNLDLTRIQVYPTNQYTPAVHRLLQVTANLYEATTNRFNDAYPHLPTVFRPRFTNDNGTVYICGYVEETNSAFLSHTLRDIVSTNVANAVQPDDLIFGVPLVIGVKKGLPNFNEFSAESVVQITRKVELVKSGPGGGNMIYQTNQMFVIGISNVFGAEFWNSYTTNYPQPVDILVTNFIRLSLTNDYNFSFNSNLVAFGVVSADSWPRWSGVQADPSFIVPLRSNHIILPVSVYRPAQNQFVPLTETFERPSGFALPRWGLAITNRVLAIIKEPGPTGRVLDYVQLSRMAGFRDLAGEMAQPRTALYFDGLWATNSPDGIHLSDQPGVIQQVLISMGIDGQSGRGDWRSYGFNQPAGATKAQEIANFLAFFAPNHVAQFFDQQSGQVFYGSNYSLIANAPFTPTWKQSLPFIWQANDPLVHYTTDDMQDLLRSGILMVWLPPSSTNISTIVNLGRLNNRYGPWGGNPWRVTDPDAYNVALKDPLVDSSDSWSFPDSEPLSLAMLGRVHRGTPWQTIYMKSADVNSITWKKWIGNPNVNDALHARPVRDWPLVALLASLLNTNDPHHLVSVNEPSTNVWLAALDGIVALTNSTPDALLYDVPPQFDPITMTSNSPQAAILAEGIRAVRAAQANQRFAGLDAVLAVSQLSVASPWLNRSSDVQLHYGISDEAYEAIPAQVLARLRPDSVGSIVPGGGGVKIQFTGFDDYAYAVESSSNLVDWVSVSTNFPTNGWFEIAAPAGVTDAQQFYRSVLLP